MILTGADGLLKYGSGACVKVRNWSLNISRDAIDVSCLNTFDREYVAGLRSATGSATLYYDPTQTTDRALLNSIFDDNSDCAGTTCLETVPATYSRSKVFRQETSIASREMLRLQLRTLTQAPLPYFKRPSAPVRICLLYTSPSPRDRQKSRMPSSA